MEHLMIPTLVNQNRTHTRQLAEKQGGFSLIELIAVVAILGILAAVVAPKIFNQPGKARMAKAKTEISNIQSALQMYKLENFNYPSTDQGLQALVEQPTGDPEAPNWQEGGYLDRLPKDPWGREYLYVSPGENGDIDIYSLGRDGQSGGEGEDADIGNWQS
jgi:general secretion pathway protein G